MYLSSVKQIKNVGTLRVFKMNEKQFLRITYDI